MFCFLMDQMYATINTEMNISLGLYLTQTHVLIGKSQLKYLHFFTRYNAKKKEIWEFTIDSIMR